MKCVRELLITLYIYVQLFFVLGQLTLDTGFGVELQLFLLRGLRPVPDGPAWPKRVGRILTL